MHNVAPSSVLRTYETEGFGVLRSRDATKRLRVVLAVAGCFALAAVVLTAGQDDEANPTELGMLGDMNHLADMKAAYIQGSVPTFAQESDEIMDLDFPDERNGADSVEEQPTAYQRGTRITFGGEATDITGVEKDVARKESLLQMPARMTQLGMLGDMNHLADMKAAYIQGSVPTFAQESDEIMDQDFPDERNGSDSIEEQPTAYQRGTRVTFGGEATDITGVEKDVARQESLAQIYHGSN